MKILHFSDIHIGKKLAGNDMGGEYRVIFDEIVSHATGQGAEVVLVSGDLIDKDASYSDESILVAGLLKLSDGGQRTVVCLTGGCDDKQRLMVLKDALARSGVYIITDPAEKIPAGDKIVESGKGYIVVRTAEGETACIAFLPYFSQGEDYNARAVKYIETAAKGFSDKHINILAAYIGIEDAACDDGRTTLTKDIFPENADYIALGGCHKTQLLDHARNIIYSGSLLGDTFEETKNKDKNAKKIIAATVNKGSETEKTVIKLAASKPLVKITATSAEQILSLLPETEGCLVSINLNVSQPLTVVEYKSIRAMHDGVMEIVLNMPPKVIKERYRVLRAGGSNEIFRNYYRTKHEAEPPRQLVAAFASIAKNIEYNINGEAQLDEIELKNIINSPQPSEALARIFHVDEFCQGVLNEIKYTEEAKRREADEVTELMGLEDELSLINDEIEAATNQLNRAAVAKDILPEFEKAVEIEKNLAIEKDRLSKLEARQKKFASIVNAETQLEQVDRQINEIKEKIANTDLEYNKTLGELRVLEKELQATERTIELSLRGLEKPTAPAETIGWLSQAVIYEEVITVYTDNIARLDKRIAATAQRIEESQKNVAAYSKAAADAKTVTEEVRKNIIALAAAESDIEGVFAALQKTHSEIECDIKRVKEIAAEIKSLIAENEAESENFKLALEGVAEQSKQKKQQLDLIAGTEHRLEKLYRQRDEQLGLSVFTQIGNNAQVGDKCPLCTETITRKPYFGEITTGSLDKDIIDAKEQLKEAYEQRDSISVALCEREQKRDTAKKRLEEIVERLKVLKAERKEILRTESEDDRRITERALVSEQNLRRVRTYQKTYEERKAILAAAEKKLTEETALLKHQKDSQNLNMDMLNELSAKRADAVFAYSKLKSAIGRDDFKRIEAELTEELKKRGQTIQAIIAHEGTRIQTLNALRKLEKTLNEIEAAQAASEEQLNSLSANRAAILVMVELVKELEKDLTKAAENCEMLKNAAKDQKNICISTMIAGDFKNAQELKKAVSIDMTASFALKSLEEKRKKLTKQIAEVNRRAEEIKEDDQFAELEQIRQMFASRDLYKIVAEEYFAETAAAASARLSEATKGRYNIEYVDGFVMVDNFSGGRHERITELTELLSDAFEL